MANTESLTGATSAKRLTAAQRRENRRLIHKEFTAAGLPTLVKAALLARIQTESHFDPTAVNLKDPNGGSAGIFQWNGPRLKALADFATRNNANPDDVQLQARFIIDEVQGKAGTEGKRGRKLFDATNPEEAAKAVIGLARPAGWTEKNPEKGLGYDYTLQRIEDFVTAAAKNKQHAETEMDSAVNSDPANLNAVLTGLEGRNTIPIPTESPLKVKQEKGRNPLAMFLGGISLLGGGLKGGLAQSEVTESQMVSNQLSGTNKSITSFLQGLPSIGQVGPTSIRR